MDVLTIAVFAFVYLGMVLGGVPGLGLDRTGVSLLGAIVLLSAGRINLPEAWAAVDVSTVALLLGLMIVSSQFRLGGFYAHVARSLGRLTAPPEAVLAAVIGAAAVLSALLANDIVCLAMAPVLVEGCARRGLNPVPFLLALACASNVGSAATLIGNPQNMLIGQVLGLSFGKYLWEGGVPAALGLIAVWAVITWQYRKRWHARVQVPHIEAPGLDSWQAAKGIIVLCALVAVFLFTGWPRDVAALTAAAVLLLSRKMASREMLELVDWHLLVLFAGLFVVNHVLCASSWFKLMTGWAEAVGIHLSHPAHLFVGTVVLSNLVSNVPATMLLLPVATHPLAGPILALSSTLAGNLFIVGSIANIIVVDQAQRLGVRITWLEHAKTGVPVTVLTLAVAAGWLWLLSHVGA